MEEKNDVVVEETTQETPQESVESQEENQEDKDALIGRLKRELTKTSKKLEEITNQPKSTPKEVDDDLLSRVSSIELMQKKRDYADAHGLTNKEADFVFSQNPNPTKETLEEDFIKHAIEGYRRKNRISENTPSSTSSSRFVSGKPLVEAITTGSKEERVKNYQKAREQILKNKRRG